MANEARIKLTEEQKAKIKDATGQAVGEIRVSNLGHNPAVTPTTSAKVATARYAAAKTAAPRYATAKTAAPRYAAAKTAAPRVAAAKTAAPRVAAAKTAAPRNAS